MLTIFGKWLSIIVVSIFFIIGTDEGLAKELNCQETLVMPVKPKTFLRIQQNISFAELERAKKSMLPGVGPGFVILNTHSLIALPKEVSPTIQELIADPFFWGNQELLYVKDSITGFDFTWEDVDHIPARAEVWENFLLHSSKMLLEIGKTILPVELSDHLHVKKTFFRYNGFRENLGVRPHIDAFPLVSVTFLDDVGDTEGTVIYPLAKDPNSAKYSPRMRLPRYHTIFFYGLNLQNGKHSPLLPGMPLTKPLIHNAGSGARIMFIQGYSIDP
ncbi:MAG: hypothetical protein KDD40_08115 [Bdellovibrionales bacterium]|nr:hypothetical protein [Bdellovibrionales bacterium]